MKKVFLSCATVLLMGAAAVYGHKAFTPQTELSPIQLKNAEAIAFDESSVCHYNKVVKDQDRNKLDCSGTGNQCCIMDAAPRTNV